MRDSRMIIAWLSLPPLLGSEQLRGLESASSGCDPVAFCLQEHQARYGDINEIIAALASNGKMRCHADRGLDHLAGL